MRTKNPMAKKPQQILFSKNTYGPRVKIENWDFANHAEKKDNYVYRDYLSNHVSTYNRWGNQDQGVGKTETRHMLEQVFTRTEPIYAFKPLVNFTSYPCTEGSTQAINDFSAIALGSSSFFNYNYLGNCFAQDRNVWQDYTTFSSVMHTYMLKMPPCTQDKTFTNKETCKKLCVQLSTPGRNKLMKKANLAELPQDFGVMDYISTQQNDYRSPYPGVTRPLTMSSPPWLLNRVIRSDLTHNHGTAPPRGDYQCLDTHTPIGHIREMRLFRYQSFDPATCHQDFPSLK